MKFPALAASLLMLAPLAGAQPVDLARSQLTFTMKQMNVPVSGSFRKFSANIDFNPQKPEAGRADIVIDTASIALPTREAEAEARKKDWFNTAQFPQARFTSTAMKALGGNRYQVSGRLTLKGVTRDVTAPFTARAENGVTLVEGSLPISRLAFRIGEGSWSDTGTVADDVQLSFRMALKGQ